jgi:hypothetical protein
MSAKISVRISGKPTDHKEMDLIAKRIRQLIEVGNLGNLLQPESIVLTRFLTDFDANKEVKHQYEYTVEFDFSQDSKGAPGRQSHQT